MTYVVRTVPAGRSRRFAVFNKETGKYDLTFADYDRASQRADELNEKEGK